MNKNILVIAAHPDDEILGCGGSMAKWIDHGHNVKVVIAAEGLTSRASNRNAITATEIEDLKHFCLRANQSLGIDSVQFLNFPDNRMDTMGFLDIVKPIETILSEYQPNWIFTHHPCDLNIDHRILYEAVVTAARPLPDSCVELVATFEILSSSGWGHNINIGNFNPNLFINIDNYLEKKLSSLSFYEAEMRPFPHARSLEAVVHLAKYKGANIGVPAAEAFQIVRQIF